MNLMHSCYACGALLCPFLIAAAGKGEHRAGGAGAGGAGLVLWLGMDLYPAGGGKAKKAKEKQVIDWSFLRSARFWLLTGLLFCQNAAEQSVIGWMVTYFKGSGIIAGTLAAYTVTVMWGATLVARLLIAFVFPFKQPRKAMVGMAVFVHHLLCAAGAWPTHRCMAMCCCSLCLLHGGYEPHRCGQRRPNDQRDQHGHHAAGGIQRCHPDAVDHWHGSRKGWPCCRYGYPTSCPAWG